MLEVVFIKLAPPPLPIQLEGLPLNDVPIYKTPPQIKCIMSNGRVLIITRDQVPLVSNFAMIDYNSQERTRKYNVVGLNNCRSHQSMYTCPFRESTYHGTAIVQGFNASKIQTGINGYLRQEFRELEMLNNITKLYYNCQLPAPMGGVPRKQVIYTFRQWKEQNYVSENDSEHIAWSENSPWSNDRPG